MTMEYIIWGKNAGEFDILDDRPLHTLSKSRKEAENIMIVLAEDHGCHSMRIQEFDPCDLNMTSVLRGFGL
jgi:hypothetical protein